MSRRGVGPQLADVHYGEARTHLLRIQERSDPDGSFRASVRDTLEKKLGAEAVAQIRPDEGIYDPGNHIVLDYIASGVDLACEALGLDTGKGVVRGVLPMRGLAAMSSDFFGTGVAIVSIQASLVTFTDWLANLIVSTAFYGEDSTGPWVKLDSDECLNRVATDEELRFEWERLFLHFAGLSVGSKLEVSIMTDAVLTEIQNIVKFQLTSAMEVFAIGHEYAHHIERHNAGETVASHPSRDDAHRFEFEADEIAWRISRFLGAAGFAGDFEKPPRRNKWMESCAGAVCILFSADAIKRTRELLEYGTFLDTNESDHPDVEQRVIALEKWHGFDVDPLKAEFRLLRSFLGRLIGGIFNQLSPRFLRAHEVGMRPRAVLESYILS